MFVVNQYKRVFTWKMSPIQVMMETSCKTQVNSSRNWCETTCTLQTGARVQKCQVVFCQNYWIFYPSVWNVQKHFARKQLSFPLLPHSSSAQRNGDLISGWYEETGWWHINCSEHCSGRRLYLKRSHTPDNELQNSKNRLKHNTEWTRVEVYSVECPAQQLSALPASTVHSSAVRWVAECKSLGGCETRNWPQFQSKSCQHQIAWNTPHLWPSGWGKWWLLTFAMLRRQRWWRWGYIWQ